MKKYVLMAICLMLVLRLYPQVIQDNGDVQFSRAGFFITGEPKAALDAFEESLKDKKGTLDLQDYINYATLLYLNNEFVKSFEIVKKGLSLAPNHVTLARLAMYDRYELGDYEAGLEDAKFFYSLADSSDYVYWDYVYYGRLLNKHSLYDDALRQYDKALALDSSNVDIYREISRVYEEQEDYSQAIEFYRKYMDVRHPSVGMGELFVYGRLNYFAAADTALKEQQGIYLSEADLAFARVADYAPHDCLGHFWRARANTLIDPEATEGLAKPYYEATLAILESKPDAPVPLLLECLSYMGYYYFLKGDYPASKAYWERILQIDADNQPAKAALEIFK